MTGEMRPCCEETKGCHGDIAKESRLYVCGHVTNIWLNYCHAQALYTKGHLTLIAGSNHRTIQLNLFAISVCRSR